jgi:amino acid adenylation domain-containing protein
MKGGPMWISKHLRPETSISVAIQTQIHSRPKSVAISAVHREVTYEELGALASRVERRLHSAGVGRGDVVALYLAPSPEFIASALASMSAGAAYLPIDLNCPAERLCFTISDSGARFLITRSELCQSVRIPESVLLLEIDRIQRGEDHVAVRLPTTDNTGPDDLAYVIYTSGSTGQPKGVEITRRGLANLVAWHNQAFQISPKDRGSHIADLSFDAAVWEIWPYLVAGATLSIPDSCVRQDPARLQQWLVAEKITVAFAPTVLAEPLSRMTWPRNTALRLLLTGGEALRAYPRRGLPFRLVNNYGPTECTVVATSGLVSPDGDHFSPPPIGRPIAQAEVYILGEDMRQVRPGETGEICIGGPSLARGYRNRPELTAEKFVASPFDRTPGARLYRTGDLAKFRDDGQIQFLGRLDDQVKIRGYRIEPNEVAVAINRNPAVRQCIVVARGGEDDEKELVAYIVPNDAKLIIPREIRESLKSGFPDYMIPSRFVCVEKLPLTARSKIDQAALPSPEPTNTPDPDRASLPSTELERQIATVVRNLLKVDKIGVEDNFFLLGGHSLFGAQLIGRLRERFNTEIPLRVVFESPTVRSLGVYIERTVSERSDSRNAFHRRNA